MGDGSLAGLATGNTTMHLVFLVEHSTPCFFLPTFAVCTPPPPSRQAGNWISFVCSLKTGGLQVTLSKLLPFLVPRFPHLYSVNMPLAHNKALRNLPSRKI